MQFLFFSLQSETATDTMLNALCECAALCAVNIIALFHSCVYFTLTADYILATIN